MAPSVHARDDHALGRRGERRAARALKRRGLRIAARRLRLPAGEVDLLALDGDTVVVVEVKSGRRTPFAELAARVGAAQRRRLARVVAWLERRPDLVGRAVRVDFVLVRFERWPRARVEHRRDQILPTEGTSRGQPASKGWA
ncbi:MAG: YraN family protein [Planctomycetota bacterium]